MALIKRERLHEMVWSAPLREVAPQLGLSNTGLAALADRAEVPRPKAGHWNKPPSRRSGVTPLPGDPCKRVRYQSSEHLHAPNAEALELELKALDTISRTPVDPTKTLAAVKVLFGSPGKPMTDGRVPMSAPGAPCVAVSPANLQRAKEAAVALVETFAKAGIPYLENGFVCGGRSYDLEVSEKVATRYEPWGSDALSWHRIGYPKGRRIDYPSGVLVIRSDNGRILIADGERQTLEAQFESLARRLWRTAHQAARTNAQEDQGRRRREDYFAGLAEAKEAAAEREREAAASAKARKRRRSEIRRDLRLWDKANRLRDFALSAEAAAARPKEWIEAVRKYADECDPLSAAHSVGANADDA